MLAAAAVRPFVGNPGVPCPLRCLTGIPCPLCGMTTSVTDAVHLHVGSALAANPMGLVAAVAAVVLVVLGRRIERLVVPALVVPVAMSVGLAGMWLFELHRFKFL
ncbi:MAG: hypothetical protein QOI20_2943 [Acidimicrobiaceae bacterium]|nr:hypothetical protein [Acidimicrobiaceae bacterium]